MDAPLPANHELRPFVLSNVRFTGTKIGGGSYGSVEEVIIPGAICAAKKIHEVFLDQSKILPSEIRKATTQFVRECKLMSTLRHPHIVQFLGVCFFPGGSRLPALVMERLLTSLHDLLEPETAPSRSPPSSPSSPDGPKPFFPLSLKCSILHNVASGLSFLHERSPPIIHRDLSARNVLLNSGMVAKIADLGVARIMPRMKNVATMTKAPGASVYMPPEAIEDYHGEDEEQGKLANQTFPCKLRAPNYHVGHKHIARTELERREHYMKLISKIIQEKHPLLRMIEKCLEFPENRPNINEVLHLLEEAKVKERDQKMEMNKLELQRALQTQPTYKAEAERKRLDAAVKKAMEEVQAKASQVKQYKKQVETLQRELREAQQKSQQREKQSQAMEEVQAKASQVKQYKKQVETLQRELREAQQKSQQREKVLVEMPDPQSDDVSRLKKSKLFQRKNATKEEDELKVRDKATMKAAKRERERSMKDGKQKRKEKVDSMDEKKLKEYLGNDINRLENENLMLKNRLECSEATTKFLVDKLNQADARVQAATRPHADAVQSNTHGSRAKKLDHSPDGQSKDTGYVNLSLAQIVPLKSRDVAPLLRPQQVKPPKPSPRSQAASVYAGYGGPLIPVPDSSQPTSTPWQDEGEYGLSSIPLDPYLECLYCNQQFRYGEIQKYRKHVMDCSGGSTV